METRYYFKKNYINETLSHRDGTKRLITQKEGIKTIVIFTSGAITKNIDELGVNALQVVAVMTVACRLIP